MDRRWVDLSQGKEKTLRAVSEQESAPGKERDERISRPVFTMPVVLAP
jgi:hypothetical protein